MTRFNRLSAAALAMALAAMLPGRVEAAAQLMCAPTTNNQAAPRTIGGSGSQVPSATLYVLDGRGCALIAQADIGFFASQGFVQDPSLKSIVFTTGVLTGTTAVQITPSLPAGAYIRDIFVDNSTANAVTGGIDIGSTSGAADIVAALTCAANCLTFVADAGLLKRVFSKTAQQAIFVVGHTAGNSANLNVTITYGFF